MFFRAATRAQQQPVEQDNPSSNLSRKKSAEADAVAGVLGGAGATSLAAGLATSANRARVGRGRHAAGRGDLYGRSWRLEHGREQRCAPA